MVFRKALVDKMRYHPEIFQIPDIMKVHKRILGSCPSQGEMTDKEYRIMLMENLVEWRCTYYKDKVFIKIAIDKIRSNPQIFSLRDIMKVYKWSVGLCPSQGKMSDEDYKKRLIEELVYWRLNYYQYLR